MDSRWISARAKLDAPSPALEEVLSLDWNGGGCGESKQGQGRLKQKAGTLGAVPMAEGSRTMGRAALLRTHCLAPTQIAAVDIVAVGGGLGGLIVKVRPLDCHWIGQVRGALQTAPLKPNP